MFTNQFQENATNNFAKIFSSEMFFETEMKMELKHDFVNFNWCWANVKDPTRREFLSTSLSNSVLIKSNTPLSPKAPHSISMTTWNMKKSAVSFLKDYKILQFFFKCAELVDCYRSSPLWRLCALLPTFRFDRLFRCSKHLNRCPKLTRLHICDQRKLLVPVFLENKIKIKGLALIEIVAATLYRHFPAKNRLVWSVFLVNWDTLWILLTHII